jgi:small-conductance mechanosensitive channel
MHWLWAALGVHSLELLVHRAVSVVAILLGALLLSALVGRAIRAAISASEHRLPDPTHRQRVVTLLVLVASLARYVIVFFASIYLLLSLGMNLMPLLTGVGVVGLAVGLGAQSLVRDVVAGFFIILEGQYGVGDQVEINGMFGTVEEVGLRITKLRDPMGVLRYLPNGSITQANRFTERCIAYTAAVPLPEGDYDATAILLQALQDFDRELRVFTDPPVLQPLQTLPSYARLLPISLHVLPGRQILVTDKLSLRLTTALARAGHPIPEGTEVTVVLG